MWFHLLSCGIRRTDTVLRYGRRVRCITLYVLIKLGFETFRLGWVFVGEFFFFGKHRINLCSV